MYRNVRSRPSASETVMRGASVLDAVPDYVYMEILGRYDRSLGRRGQ